SRRRRPTPRGRTRRRPTPQKPSRVPAAMRKNILLALAFLLALPLAADEGMWLFNHPPRQILKQRYGFEPSQAWLDHLQRSSIRFNSGGSGSFVSASGLILTNHHVALDCL